MNFTLRMACIIGIPLTASNIRFLCSQFPELSPHQKNIVRNKRYVRVQRAIWGTRGAVHFHFVRQARQIKRFLVLLLDEDAAVYIARAYEKINRHALNCESKWRIWREKRFEDALSRCWARGPEFWLVHREVQLIRQISSPQRGENSFFARTLANRLAESWSLCLGRCWVGSSYCAT